LLIYTRSHRSISRSEEVRSGSFGKNTQRLGVTSRRADMSGVVYYKSDDFNMVEIKTCSNDVHAYKDHLHEELSVGYIEEGASILNVNGNQGIY